MLKIQLSKQAKKFLEWIPVKHSSQISKKVLLLAQEFENIQSQELKWYQPYRRIKSGEYRIIFKIEDNILFISLIWKRNDDEIYKMVERFLG